MKNGKQWMVVGASLALVFIAAVRSPKDAAQRKTEAELRLKSRTATTLAVPPVPKTTTTTITSEQITARMTELAAAPAAVPPPYLTNKLQIARVPGNVVVSWLALAGTNYVVQSLPVLNGGATWADLSQIFVGDGTVKFFTNAVVGGGKSFYRLRAYQTPAAMPGDLQWVRAGTCVQSSQCKPGGVACDHNGNVVQGGWFITSVDFGTGVLTNAAALSEDAYLVKYNSAGTVQWAKRFGAQGNDEIRSVACDSAGNIIVCGIFTGTVDFGGQSLTSVSNSTFGCCVIADAFVAKYSPAGALLWVKGYGGVSGEYANAVAVDGGDNILVSTSIESPNVHFDSFTFSTTGFQDIILLKLNPSGAVQWAKQYGSSGDADWGYAIAVDKFNDVAIAGNVGSGGNLGGGGLVNGGLFVAKYSGVDGSYRWAKVPGGGNALGVATDPGNGNVVFTGTISGPTDFGTGTTASGGMFLTSYSSAGTNLWGKTFNTAIVPPGDQSANGVSIDAAGNIALTGKSTTVNFGNGFKNYQGYFVADFTRDGAFRWVKAASLTGNRVGYAVAFDSADGVVAAGTFGNSVKFDGSTQTNTTPTTQGAPFSNKYVR